MAQQKMEWLEASQEINRLKEWLQLIQKCALGMTVVSPEFQIIADWCAAALAGQKR